MLPNIYRNIGDAYAAAGFKDKGIYYVKEALKLDEDSASYYRLLARFEDLDGKYTKAIDYGEKSYAIDSISNPGVIFLLGINHSYLGQEEEYLEYMTKFKQRMETRGERTPFQTYRVGHAYWVNGLKKEAESYFKEVLEFHQEMIELGRHYYQDLHTFYNLAAIHAFLGDKDKAYQNLRLVNERQGMPLWVVPNIKNDPSFDDIRNEPKFQQIVKEVEVKYQAEHERVRAWLEEERIL